MQYKNATDFSYVSAATPLPVVLYGVTTNSNAAAGQVGELISSSLAQASALSLTDNTPVDVTSISLTAGDWDVTGTLFWIPVATTEVTAMSGGVSTTSATIPSSDNIGGKALWQVPWTSNGGPSGLAVPPIRLSLASTTTVYLVIQANFSVSTCKGFGNIRARRVR